MRPGEAKPGYVAPDARPKRDIVAMQPGDHVRLADGSVREIVVNPMDGIWMIVKEIGVEGADDEMALITEILGPA
jgi:hypothetical protein